jgi:hypothetical protein
LCLLITRIDLRSNILRPGKNDPRINCENTENEGPQAVPPHAQETRVNEIITNRCD